MPPCTKSSRSLIRRRIVARIRGGVLRPTGRDFAMLRLTLITLLPLTAELARALSSAGAGNHRSARSAPPYRERLFLDERVWDLARASQGRGQPALARARRRQPGINQRIIGPLRLVECEPTTVR